MLNRDMLIQKLTQEISLCNKNDCVNCLHCKYDEVADFIIAMKDTSHMKYYAFKNIRNGKYISGTNYNTYPYRQILADEYRPPKLFAEDDVAREVMHRQINLNTYKVVEVQIKE